MRWVPIVTALGNEVSADVDTALAALAAYAQRLRCWNNLIIALATAAIVAPLSLGVRVPTALVLAAVALVLVRAARTGLIWFGKPGILTLIGQQMPRADLPPVATELLAELRSSQKRMRIKWSEADSWSDLSTDVICRPFGALLLSSDPDVQLMALFSWRQGATPAIEVQLGHRAPEAAFPKWPDRCLALPPETLAKALRQVMGNIDVNTASMMKFDAMMTANDLLRLGLCHQSPKVLVDAVCDFLLAPCGEALMLNPAAYGTRSPERITLSYRRTRSEAHGPKLGLRRTDSLTWMEQAFTGRYPNFSESLKKIAVPDEA
jgi:hypothetical protein